MGKIVFWILVGLAVVLLVKQIGPARKLARQRRAGLAGRGGDGEAGDERAPTHDVILACAVCGLHVPASEAVFASGRVYCSEAHRDEGRAVLANDRG